MKNLEMLKSRVSALALVVSAAVLSGVAQAAITSAELTPISDAIAADAGTVAGWAFTLLGTIMGLVIGFKLTKKFITSST